MGGNSGKLCPWASLHDLQVVQQVQEFSLPKVLPAYMTLGREGPCESDKFQVLSKICELFPSWALRSIFLGCKHLVPEDVASQQKERRREEGREKRKREKGRSWEQDTTPTVTSPKTDSLPPGPPFCHSLIAHHIIKAPWIKLVMKSVPSWPNHSPQTLLWILLYWRPSLPHQVVRSTFQIEAPMALLLMMVVCVHSHVCARVSVQMWARYECPCKHMWSQRKVWAVFSFSTLFFEAVSPETWNLRFWLGWPANALLALACLSLKARWQGQTALPSFYRRAADLNRGSLSLTSVRTHWAISSHPTASF